MSDERLERNKSNAVEFCDMMFNGNRLRVARSSHSEQNATERPGQVDGTEGCRALTRPIRGGASSVGRMRIGTFVLADIGGYTTFLSDVGVEHGKEITSHLLNGMFEVDSDVWQLGNVEGDCLFVYSEGDLSLEDVFGYLRRVYENFRESLEEVVTGSTCACGACDRSGDLTLKFVVHRGEFDVQQIAGQQHVIGSDVVVAHRLLKNSVPVREYALLSSAVLDVSHDTGFAAVQGSDTYDDRDPVEYVYVDFAEVRADFHRRRAVFLTEADADVVVRVDIDAPPDLVWDAVMNIDRAPELFPTIVRVETLAGAVEEAGSVHTCLHGDGMHAVHYRVAYDAESRRLTDRLTGVPVAERMLQTFEAKPSGTGTRLSVFYALQGETEIDDPELKRVVLETIRDHTEADGQGVKASCEAEFARGLLLDERS